MTSVTAGVADALAREGYQVQEEKVFFDLEDAARIWHVISRAGVAWLMGRGDGRLGAMAGASVRAMAADGAKLTGADYIDALERVSAFRRRCAELFARTDLVLTRRPPLCRGRLPHRIRIGSRIARQAPAIMPRSQVG